jgi:hypothetical protein
MINLFYAPHALLACLTHHAGGSGAAYTAVRVDFAKSEQRQPEYAEAGTATSD